jgi:hypothetical protein
MSLPHGSTAVAEGSLAKGLPIMLLGGVLAWVSGHAWVGITQGMHVFQLLMVVGTLATVSVPAQLIAGPRARPWLMASVGALGLGVPWFFGLAVERGGQDVVRETAVVTTGAWVLAYAVTWMTRRAIERARRG